MNEKWMKIMEQWCGKDSVSLNPKNEGEGSVIRCNIANETLIQGGLQEGSDASEMRRRKLKWFHSAWADDLGSTVFCVGKKHITTNNGWEPRQPHLLTCIPSHTYAYTSGYPHTHGHTWTPPFPHSHTPHTHTYSFQEDLCHLIFGSTFSDILT